MLTEPLIEKLQVPSDKVRISLVGLDNDVGDEEYYMNLRDTINHMLTIISHRHIDLLKTALERCQQMMDQEQM